MATPQRPQRPQRPQGQNQGYGKPNQNNPYMQGNNQEDFFDDGFQNGYPQQRRNVQQQGYMSDEMMLQQQMQKKKKNTLKVILIILGIIVFLVGEGFLAYYVATGRISQKVPELEAEVENWEIKYDNLMSSKNNEIDKLKQAVNEMTVKEVIPTTSLQRVKGQYVQELWLIEGDFIAPNSLNIPDVSDTVNDSYVQIGTIFTLKPSDRWTMVSQGTTWEFSHPNKIWGKIRALKRSSSKSNLSDEEMRAIVQEFFVTDSAKYPNLSDITYRKIFYDNYQFGIVAKAQFPVYYTEDEDINYQILTGKGSILTDEEGIELPENFDGINTKDMTINIGFVSIGENTLSFIFVYDSEGGGNSQELIDLLLKSCSLGPGGNSIKLE